MSRRGVGPNRLPRPSDRTVAESLAKLPPGPYEVRWPAEQGGVFTLWGRQGTPPDFTDGWAIPLVASGVDTAMFALRDLLAAAALRGSAAQADGGEDEPWEPWDIEGLHYRAAQADGGEAPERMCRWQSPEGQLCGRSESEHDGAWEFGHAYRSVSI
jgi:hypothetical protein